MLTVPKDGHTFQQRRVGQQRTVKANVWIFTFLDLRINHGMKQNNFVKVLDQGCCSLKMTKNRNSFHNTSGMKQANVWPLYNLHSANGNGQESLECGFVILIFRLRIRSQMIIVNGIHIWIMISGKQINRTAKKIRTHVDTFQQVQAAITGEQRPVPIWIRLLARLILEQWFMLLKNHQMTIIALKCKEAGILRLVLVQIGQKYYTFDVTFW